MKTLYTKTVARLSYHNTVTAEVFRADGSRCALKFFDSWFDSLSVKFAKAHKWADDQVVILQANEVFEHDVVNHT